MSMIPAEFHGLVHGPHTAVLTTVSPDGSPHSTPVWFLFDGESLLVSTVANRPKHLNVLRDPRVSFTVIDPDQPMHYVEVKATARAEPDPTCEWRDQVVRKHGYADGAAFDRPGTERVILRLTPTRVIGR